MLFLFGQGYADDVVHGPDWRQLMSEFDAKSLSQQHSV